MWMGASTRREWLGLTFIKGEDRRWNGPCLRRGMAGDRSSQGVDCGRGGSEWVVVRVVDEWMEASASTQACLRAGLVDGGLVPRDRKEGELKCWREGQRENVFSNSFSSSRSLDVDGCSWSSSSTVCCRNAREPVSACRQSCLFVDWTSHPC